MLVELSVQVCWQNIPGKRPSPLRSASCRQKPWPRKECAASHSGPSTSLREACRPRLQMVRMGFGNGQRRKLTELDAGVVLADLLTLLVGEEHVCRETTLGRVGVC